LALSADGRIVAAGGPQNTLVLWDVATGRALRRSLGHPRLISAAFSPDGKLLAHAGDRGVLIVEDALTGHLLWKIAHQVSSEQAVTDVGFSPDGKLLAVGDWFNRIRLLDAQTGKLRREWTVPNPRQGINGSNDETHWVSFSHDGTLLASGGFSGANVWQVQDGRLRQRLRGCGRPAFLADDSAVIAADEAGQNLWQWQL
jgi:WD40 repeat protein